MLDQWLKHMCPNEKTDPVEGFNVPELMTLDDVNIMVYIRDRYSLVSPTVILVPPSIT